MGGGRRLFILFFAGALLVSAPEPARAGVLEKLLGAIGSISAGGSISDGIKIGKNSDNPYDAYKAARKAAKEKKNGNGNGTETGPPPTGGVSSSRNKPYAGGLVTTGSGSGGGGSGSSGGGGRTYSSASGSSGGSPAPKEVGRYDLYVPAVDRGHEVQGGPVGSDNRIASAGSAPSGGGSGFAGRAGPRATSGVVDMRSGGARRSAPARSFAGAAARSVASGGASVVGARGATVRGRAGQADSGAARSNSDVPADSAAAAAAVERAYRRLEAGDAKVALGEAETAIAADREDPRGWFAKAQALRELKLWPQAEEAARRVVELAPEVPEAHWELGWALLEQGKFAEAVESFTRALAFDADSQQAYIGRALAYEGLGERERMLADLRAVNLLGNGYRHLLDRALAGKKLFDPNKSDAYALLSPMELPLDEGRSSAPWAWGALLAGLALGWGAMRRRPTRLSELKK
jgi:Tfp pilus assembly protein PilF